MKSGMAASPHRTKKDLSHSVARLFATRGSELVRVRELACRISTLIDALGPFLLRHTREVCPGCRDVCCIDRHSVYAYDDIVYLSALGGQLAPRKEGLPEESPCQFLGQRGCVIRHALRPYRCTWYFCSALLDRIELEPLREYKEFLGLLEQITRTRKDLLDSFADVAKKAGIGPGERL